MIRRLVVTVGLAAVLGVGLAAGPAGTVGSLAFKGAASTLARDPSLLRAGIHLAEGATPFVEAGRTALTWGSRVAYYGNIVMIGAFVFTALNWLYEQAKLATGSSLDEWWEGGPGPPAASWGPFTTTGNTYPLNKAAMVTGAIGMDLYLPEWGATEWVYKLSNGGWHYGVVRFSGDLSAGPGEVSGYGKTAYTCQGSNESCYAWATTQADIKMAEYLQSLGRSYGGTRLPLVPWLDGHPDAEAALRDQVLPDYLDEQLSDPTYPDTYPSPLPDGGIELDPAPNVNQWWDNPFRDPALDTDSDGWKDWEEWRLGSDPSNPYSYPDPNGDPDGDGATNDEERIAGTDPADPNSRPGEGPMVDSDGDGIADSADPCPFDAMNGCVADGSDLDELLDGVAQESTQRSVLGELRGIRDQLNRGEDTGPLPSGSAPELAPVIEHSLSYDAWTAVASGISSSVTNWWDDASTRVPFALANGWLPTGLVVVSGECSGINMTILGSVQQVGLCGTAMDTWLSGIGRAALLGVALLGFYLSAAGIVTRL